MALDPNTIRCEGTHFFPSSRKWGECPKRKECARWLHLGSLTYWTPRAYHLCRGGMYDKFLPVKDANLKG